MTRHLPALNAALAACLLAGCGSGEGERGQFPVDETDRVVPSIFGAALRTYTRSRSAWTLLCLPCTLVT